MRTSLAIAAAVYATALAACCGIPGPSAGPVVNEKQQPPHPENQSAPAGQWLNAATESFAVPSIVVKVSRAGIGLVPLLRLGQLGESSDEHLMVTVDVSNPSRERKLDYKPWSSSFSQASLKDDLGNRYRMIEFGLSDVVGRSPEKSIYYGKAASDILVFERPVDAAKRLYLELPVDATVSASPLRFTFQRPRPYQFEEAKQPSSQPKTEPKAQTKQPKAESPKPAEPPALSDEEKAQAAEEKAKKNERAADGKLTLTKELLRDPNKAERGKEKLKEIIRDYPGTKAAIEAERLLKAS